MGAVYSLREIEAGPVTFSEREYERLKERGEHLYDEKLAGELEAHHLGEFLLIEPDSGRYFAGRDEVAVMQEAHAAMPDKRFYMMRVSYQAIDVIGTSLKRRRRSVLGQSS